ncbi:MAG: fluoride efflux transporter CrcB [Granulosicoccus sp.]
MSVGAGFVMVAAGGAMGACARYALTILLLDSTVRFPLATLVANLSGAFLAGFIISFLWSRGLSASPVYLLLVTGFLGSFTTLSAFSVETLKLMQTGALSAAIANVSITVGGALLAVTLGARLARFF